MTAKVLAIDDEERMTSLLRRILSYAGYSVRVAHDGAAGLDLAQQYAPDLVVLDVMLPDLDGVAVCRRLRQSTISQILMLTARDAIPDRVRGLDAGADDYLIKPFAVEELLARVRALLRRSASEEDAPDEALPPLLTFSDLTLDTRTRSILCEDRSTALSTIEFKLLRLFLLHPRQVLTRDLLMTRVWGPDYQRESNVLEVYVHHLRLKLERQGLPRLIRTVRGAGYALQEEQACRFACD